MTLNSRRMLGVLAVVLISGLAGCNSNSNTNTGANGTKTLYERLGGHKAIEAVVDDFVNRAAADPAVNFTRKGVAGAEWNPSPENVAKLKKHLTQFICLATGGPEKYEGRDNKSVHAGMQITNAEFDALAVDLGKTLLKFKVPEKETNDLMQIVETTRSEIVEKK